MKKARLGAILLVLLLISGCSGLSASSSVPSSSSSSTPPPSSSPAPLPESSSSTEDTEASAPEEPGPPVHLQVLSADSLSDALKADQQLFREQLAGSRHPEEEYFYLYVVDENGEPVSNLQCYPGNVNWEIRQDDTPDIGYGDLSKRLGLSRNSGLLPIPVAKFAEKGSSVLCLCNDDIEYEFYNAKPAYVQETEISEELLEQLGAGNLLQFVWEGEKPIDTMLALDHIEVTVIDSDGQPAADRVVYIHFPASQLGPDPSGAQITWVDCPYEPRYTDQNGVARFVRENTFGSTPGGEREIVVMPCFVAFVGEFDSAQKKTVHIDVPPAPPWEFEIVLD